MIEEAYINATIVSLRPDAVYRNKVYTQFVDLEANNTMYFTAYDPMNVQAEYLGRSCKIWLTTFMGRNNLQEVSSREVGVKSDRVTRDNLESLNDEAGVVLYGQVLAIDTIRDSFVLDIGIGTIVCDGNDVYDRNSGLHVADRKVQVGDYVIHHPTRIDLRKIEC